mmetsp:Transcript_11633/g.27345  ORF Transcript_11633/g.27345 Transcript_11633/m.27345 type:complete len:219 (+) Transcript_11633:252-908(+)
MSRGEESPEFGALQTQARPCPLEGISVQCRAGTLPSAYNANRSWPQMGGEVLEQVWPKEGLRQGHALRQVSIVRSLPAQKVLVKKVPGVSVVAFLHLHQVKVPKACLVHYHIQGSGSLLRNGHHLATHGTEQVSTPTLRVEAVHSVGHQDWAMRHQSIQIRARHRCCIQPGDHVSFRRRCFELRHRTKAFGTAPHTAAACLVPVRPDRAKRARSKQGH